MDVPFKRLRPEGALPSTQHPGDAGLDLRAAIDATVKPGERVMVPTGVAVAIPDGHAGLVLPRSGLAAARGLTLSNSPGLIDAGYRGEVICSVVNLDRDEAVEIRAGEGLGIVPGRDCRTYVWMLGGMRDQGQMRERSELRRTKRWPGRWAYGTLPRSACWLRGLGDASASDAARVFR